MVAFDDRSSVGHLFLGFVAGMCPVGLALSIGGLFTLYQLSECERLRHKLGDFVEFGLGVGSARIVGQG